MYERFVLPFERKVADALHAAVAHVPIYTHTCGMLNDRLELLVEHTLMGWIRSTRLRWECNVGGC